MRATRGIVVFEASDCARIGKMIGEAGISCADFEKIMQFMKIIVDYCKQEYAKRILTNRRKSYIIVKYF